MPTTIQINESTLELLKKIKKDLEASSYDEAITKMVINESQKESLAGFLGKKSRKDIMGGLRDKHDRI
ncbi:hypothetical protein COU56_01605 [Candidatus Pacearchaeota archaeon CG10_big_fil_rev_8_21_14_0_10_31_9]|nr:MAG: hypothetical protein AUJ62_01015 [Candidatus Pacearchaeota archaeon CG1_02_32_21]PIN95426.1 MAG: hypothetical protein COU56_01605 [Candidatus Pacearchaeota archaeon CG10_big_fil_rev_8_21_14_0_10_31_9]PIZ82440.1 MAG: hypothetical protein COX97_04760 [Candidatus Pacearchaeota archaeon CG_4_10_14_0_2_um_filter_05_32_18]